MTANDFKERFNAIISDVAGHADDAVLLLDEVTNDYSAASALADELETAKARISELETVNQKLYLAAADDGEVEEVTDDAEELTGVDAIAEFWDEVDREEKSEL